MPDENPTLDEGASIESVESTADETVANEADALFDDSSNEEALESDANSESEVSEVPLDHVASMLGLKSEDLDVNEDGKVVFKTKIDNEEGIAKAEDFRTTYQKQGHLDNLTREAKQQIENINAQKTEAQNQQAQKLEEVGQLYQVAINELNREYNSVDWEELKNYDPGRFAMMKSEFQERNQALRAHLQQTQAKRQEIVDNQRKEFEAGQLRKLPSIIPGWDKRETAEKEFGEIKEYASKSLSNEFVNVASNYAEGVAIMRKAMLYDRMEESKPEIEKAVRSAVKVSRPGGASSKKATAEKSIEDIFYS